jgi:hypothetical protein
MNRFNLHDLRGINLILQLPTTNYLLTKILEQLGPW